MNLLEQIKGYTQEGKVTRFDVEGPLNRKQFQFLALTSEQVLLDTPLGKLSLDKKMAVTNSKNAENFSVSFYDIDDKTYLTISDYGSSKRKITGIKVGFSGYPGNEFEIRLKHIYEFSNREEFRLQKNLIIDRISEMNL